MKRTIEEEGVWRLTHLAPEGAAESLTLEAFGQKICVRRELDGTIDVWGLPKRRNTKNVVDMGGIAAKALEESGFTLEALRGPARFKQINAMRYKVMSALREAGATYAEIGGFLCRGHSAVIAMLTRPLKPQASVVGRTHGWKAKPRTPKPSEGPCPT